MSRFVQHLIFLATKGYSDKLLERDPSLGGGLDIAQLIIMGPGATGSHITDTSQDYS
jgi:hypothetical protein